jgi:septal ring factor EnvC (AmiA/AmiB activator)
MESKNSGQRPILLLLVLLCIAMLYSIFSSHSNLREATRKIEEVQKDLHTAQDSLERSTTQINKMLENLKSTETSLSLIRSQVQSIDFNYKLSKATSGIEIKAIKEKIEKEAEEQQKLIEELKKLK